MESKLITLFDYIKQLCESDIDRIIEFVLGIFDATKQPIQRPDCPRCSCNDVIKYGNRITNSKKQRFLCKGCGRTFMYSTNTVMQFSHQTRSVWADFISDTLCGVSLDESAEKYHFSHVTAFNMRHKVLMALEDWQEINPTILSGISELDETFVLESRKGTKIPENADRKPRKHGAKAQKPGISSEQIAICAGIQRDGGVIAETVNRAKPSGDELMEVFREHIAEGTLILTDGLRSYHKLNSIPGCTVKDVTSESEGGVFNLNTVNRLHSYIKDMYNHYCGVATKYLNRYNALFSFAYRTARSKAKEPLSPTGIAGLPCWYSISDIHTRGLLVI